MSEGNQNGWNEYSRLVLKELETLAHSINSLRTELQEIKQDMAAMRVREDKIDELKVWKEKVDEVASPTQLKEWVLKVEEHERFKTKAVTVFAVIQFVMAVLIAISSFL